MSQLKNLDAQLTRRSWIVLATAALSGCGGGGSGGSTAGMAPGTGGTGIYAQGSISGFGSVIINGIKFDDVQASAKGLVQIDGMTLTSDHLRLGMVAGVQGERSVVDATLGTANSIEVWSIAQGLVTSTQVGAFTLAGMTVQTDSATVLDGISAVAQLVSGMRVVVWGLQAGADGSHWRATRVAVTSGTEVVSTGLVSVAGAQRTLNGLLLTGAASGTLTGGTLVRVQGALSAADGSLAVAKVKLLSGDGLAARQGEAEIEGLVTAILSTTRFMLGAVEVDVSSVSGVSAQVTVGARLEVYGTWQVGVLKASKVEFEDALTLQEVEIEAPIEAFTSVANFVVRGQRCDATGATISHGTAADLRVGVKVHLKGTKAGDVLRVTELELAS